MATKSSTSENKITNFNEECNLIKQKIFNGSVLFNENDHDEDDDEEVERLITDEEAYENLETWNMEGENCLCILYLGSMNPISSLNNNMFNCLYNQIYKFYKELKKKDQELNFVYILFIGPDLSTTKRKNNITEKINEFSKKTAVILEYINLSLPIISETKNKLEQLHILNKYIINNKKPLIDNLSVTNMHNAKSSLIISGKNNKQLVDVEFSKPAIPETTCSFIEVFENIFNFFMKQSPFCRVQIVNGFWFDTNNKLQDDTNEYIVYSIDSYTGNGLLSYIPYFIPLISKMKSKYGEKFVFVNQYFDKWKKINNKIYCNDITPYLLEYVAEITTNGNKFLIDKQNELLSSEKNSTESIPATSNTALTKGGKKKRKKKTRRKKSKNKKTRKK